MGNKFQQQKGDALKGLAEAREKGEADEGMLPLLDRINSLPDYYTTSSCTGRITLFHDPGGKKGSCWSGKWHREVSVDEIREAVKHLPKTGSVWFMHEPTIIHVVARTLDGASKLVDLARNNGYKKVGILSYKDERILVEICGTERIDAPVADQGRVLVDDQYICYLTDLANRKFKKGRDRLKRFEQGLGRSFSPDL